MGIISKTSSGVQAQPKPFPKLMISNIAGSVLLMTDRYNGTIVLAKGDYPIGTTDDWEDFADYLVDYNGTVSLSNE